MTLFFSVQVNTLAASTLLPIKLSPLRLGDPVEAVAPPLSRLSHHLKILLTI